MTARFSPGALIQARGREWVVLPESEPDLLVVRPIGGGDDDTAAVFPALEDVRPATFRPPTVDDSGDASSAGLLRTALRIGFRSSAGPFRSLARLAVEPRAYQYVPLMMALRQDVTRMLIADDVGIGKTVEAGMIVAELIAQGDITRLAVLCSPALAEQWQQELREKFAIHAELVLPSTVTKLTRGLLLTESLFERHPYVVVSTDFIKLHQRRDEFVNHCPELVIVDEAHTAVADGSATTARTQRYELMQRVAANPRRHLVLVTATPHSGKEEAFRNLIGLLDPALATIDLDRRDDRIRLARHFVQRRRANLASGEYLGERTIFPSQRLTKEAPYQLSADYHRVFERVLDYAREQITDEATGRVRQRVRWWAALALLRALASSPRAAAATLRTRANAAGAETVEEADVAGRAAVMDTTDDEAFEAIDATPGGDANDADTSNVLPHRRRLLALATQAEQLENRTADRKLVVLIGEVKALLADGYDPIVFCRFIATAYYVEEQLTSAIGANTALDVVTGDLPPAERMARIAELVARPGRHVLIATDCLSEGVNLQEHFDAVIHYDLAWNPTRHEQREGRVDRFGQTRDVVRAVTLYGVDNQIDGIVLDVLLRKYQAIRQATGVSVPVPDRSDNVIEALLEGLVLRGRETNQLQLDLGLDREREDLHRDWEAAADREKASRERFAQESIKPDEVAREVATARGALGTHAEVETFARESLRALGSTVTIDGGGLTATVATLPVGLRDAFPPRTAHTLRFNRDLPVAAGDALLARTDPHVEALGRFVLDTALDPTLGHRVASRAGIVRTGSVTKRTTLLVARFRFSLDIPNSAGITSVVAEEAAYLAFEGPPASPVWLVEPAIDRLMQAQPDANLEPDQARELLDRVLQQLGDLEDALADYATKLADELREAHHRVRGGAGARRRGLRVIADQAADLLGVYVYLPLTPQ
jgi:superfamily II DNA or RNA helicase